MGSLETGVPSKRTPLLRSSLSSAGRSFLQRPRSRLARFLLFEKVDYLQWICTAAAFFFVVILFQAFLPGSIPEKSPGRSSIYGDRGLVAKNFLELEFGEGIRFLPTKLLERFEKERKEADSFFMESERSMTRMGLRKPRLALVFGGLSPDAMQVQMVSIATSLKEIGYEIEYNVGEGTLLGLELDHRRNGRCFNAAVVETEMHRHGDGMLRSAPKIVKNAAAGPLYCSTLQA